MVVPTYHRPEALAACLRALARQTLPRSRFEVIVCDDGSVPPASAAPVVAEAGRDLDVRVVHRPRGGPAAARNRGAAAARAPYLAFTDDDCTPQTDWLERLQARFEDHPDALIGGGLDNGLEDDPCASATQAIMDFVYAYQERRENRFRFSTSNLALPRSGFESLGGFDTSFSNPGGEDYDLCLRWQAAGRPAIYAPEARIVHWHPVTVPGFLRQHFTYGKGLIRTPRRAGPGARRFEPLGFYAALVLHPVRRVGWRGLRQALLIAAAQAATAGGALAARVRGGAERAARRTEAEGAAG